MRRKSVVIALSLDDFRVLDELADIQERTAQQQALFLLRRVLQKTEKEQLADENSPIR